MEKQVKTFKAVSVQAAITLDHILPRNIEMYVADRADGRKDITLEGPEVAIQRIALDLGL